MSWSIRRTGQADAVRARLKADFAAIEKDSSQHQREVDAARWAASEIESVFTCPVPADYFGDSVPGWKVEASASFSREGMLQVSISVDRVPLEIVG